ncbi:DUF6745 domain-containing protein [Qipengyuania sp. SM2507]
MAHSYFSEKHHDLIDKAVNFGFSIGLRSDRSDRAAAELALAELYIACGISPPEKVLWFESPYESVKALAAENKKERWGYHTDTWRKLVGDFASLKASAIPQHDPRVPYDIRHIKLDLSSRIDMKVWHWVGAELSKDVRKRTRMPVNAVASHVGAHFNARHAAEIYVLERLGQQVKPELVSFRRATELLWWWHPGEKIAYASEPPIAVHLDVEPRQPRLHCKSGKAIQFADGTGFSSWHGQVIPDRWVDGKPPSPEQAVSRKNEDERAVACEIVGWNRIFDALSARKIDEHNDGNHAALWEISIAAGTSQRYLDCIDRRGQRTLILVDNSISSVAQAKAGSTV